MVLEVTRRALRMNQVLGALIAWLWQEHLLWVYSVSLGSKNILL